jgi:hypothetical protein
MNEDVLGKAARKAILVLTCRYCWLSRPVYLCDNPVGEFSMKSINTALSRKWEGRPFNNRPILSGAAYLMATFPSYVAMKKELWMFQVRERLNQTPEGTVHAMNLFGVPQN